MASIAKEKWEQYKKIHKRPDTVEATGRTMGSRMWEQYKRTHARPENTVKVPESVPATQATMGSLITAEETQVPNFSIVPSAMQFGSEGLTDAQKNQIYYSQMAEEAEKAMADYLASEEYQQNKAENYRQYNAEHKWDGLKNAFNPLTWAGEALPSADGIEEMADSKEQELRALAEQYRALATSGKDQLTMETDMAEYRSWPKEDQAALQTYIIDSNRQFWSTEPSFDNARFDASALFEKYGAKRVKEIAESFSRWQNSQLAGQVEETARSFAEEHPVLGAAAARVGNLVGSATGAMGYLQEMTGRTGRYSTLDPNNVGSVPGAFAGAVDQQNVENIRGEEHEGITWGDVGATAYQAGMSALDSLARMVAGGGYGSLALAATGSFGQTVSEISARGGSPVQAIAMGVVSGGLEVVTEKVSLDNLLKQAKGGYKNLLQTLKAAFIAGGVEVSEEELNFLGSILAETVILQGKSSYSQQITELVAGGMSYQDAVKQADLALVNEAAQTAIQSFLSGGMMSGATTMYSNTLSRIQARAAQRIGNTATENTPAIEAETKSQESKTSGNVPRNTPTVPENTQTVPQEGAYGTLAGQNGTENTGNVPQVGRNNTEDKQPVSIAEQVRREQSENGGMNYVTETGLQLGAAFADTGTGNNLPDGSTGRYVGTGTGEQTGSVGTVAKAQWSGQRIAEAQTVNQRQNSGRSLRYVSSQDLGLQSGTETKNIKVLPQEMWDETLQRTAAQIQEDTGKEVTFVLGRIQIRGSNGKTAYARGVISGDQIIVQADNARIDAERIADHEIYHFKSGSASSSTHRRIKEHIVETFSREEFERVLDRYLDGLVGVIDIPVNASGEDIDAAVRAIEEEIFADAYAGINSFGAHAENWTEAVHQKMEELGPNVGKAKLQENGVRETNGPPSERYSADDTQDQEPKELTLRAVDEMDRTSSVTVDETVEGKSYEQKTQITENGALPFETGTRKGTPSGNAPSELNVLDKTKGVKNETKSSEFYSADDIHSADVEVLRNIGRKSINEFTTEDIQKSKKWARKFYNELGVKSPFFRAWFGDWRAGDTSRVRVLQLERKETSPAGKAINVDTGKSISWGRDYFREVGIHQRSGGVASEIVGNAAKIVENAVYFDTVVSMPTSKRKMPNTAFMHHMYVLAEYEGNTYLEKMYVEEALNNKETEVFTRAYTLKDIKKVAQIPNSVLSGEGGLTGGIGATDISVADLFAIVKEYDPEFKPKPSSKAVNEDGTPKVVYHGSYQNFSVFDGKARKHSAAPDGSHFFTDNMDVGYSYTGYKEIAKPGSTYKGGIYPVYLNIRDPLTINFGGQHWSEKLNGKDINEWAQYAKNQGYDGLITENIIDEGGQGDRDWNESTVRMAATDYVVFDSEQIKSATDNIGTFDGGNPDIRYSVDDSDIQQEEKPKKKAVQPVAESKPIIAKRDLKNTLNNLFSIPAGQKAEMGTVIDSFADRLIKNGELTEADRSAFFDRMYEAGVMTVQADDYFREGRNLVAGGKVYVDDSLRADFGDDWESFRRRAFAAGVYLTSNRVDGGVDMWNHELAGILPGLFDSEETDNRMILERIIQIAEEGRDEKVSLAEYTARLAETEHIPEEEFLDNMERQMDWALRTFAEKADLELKLRDRTGKKINEERQKGRERMTQQRLRETQRRAEERQERKEMARRQRERKELRELQQKTLKQLQWLSRNQHRAPEELRAAWDEVLGDIDIYAVSAANEMNRSDKYNATWKDLAQMYKDAMKNDPNFLPSKELEKIIARLDGTKIADMDVGALQDLYKAAIGLRTEFYNRNNVINDEMNRLFAEVYTDSKKEIESAPGAFKGKLMDQFLNLDQLTPMNVLQRMGGWNPNGAFYSMAKQLEQGERDVRAYSVKAKKMLQSFLEEHEDWVKRADGQGKDAIWYEVEVHPVSKIGFGDTPIFSEESVKVYMTPSQKVHMYLESKNLDNLRHMVGGRTFVNKELYSHGKRKEALAQGDTIKLAPETVRKLVSDMTAEEMELARILDQYYNTFATQEINRISNILYGYDKAMGKSYAPIYTDQNYNRKSFEIEETMAENTGSLKERINAGNPSYNISAFDAFDRHVDRIARFCGMAIPTRNWDILLNWQETGNSTRKVIAHKWGDEAKEYINELIMSMQGEHRENEGGRKWQVVLNRVANKALDKNIAAIFGANPSIVLKQIGSVPAASAYLDARNFPKPSQIRNIDRELIAKYTPDLEWRTMGYTTPETKLLKDNPNWTETNRFTKFIFGGGAITATDGWAASILWPWAENKVTREYTELKPGSEEFYKKVAEEFEYALSRSQSVTDEIHQSEVRKNKSAFSRALTMFRSDSAQTYNIIRQKIGETQYHIRAGSDEATIQKAKKEVGTAVLATIVGYMWAESVELLMNLWKHKGKKYRNEEDELTAESILSELGMGILYDMAGIVTGGQELAEFIGNKLTGEKWYDIETPGMEQLNDVLTALDTASKSIGKGDIIGGVKEVASTAATYFAGIPVANLESYLLGTMRWLAPEIVTEYEDILEAPGKSDLSGLEGKPLVARVGNILENRNMSDSDDTAKAIAALYESGYTGAVPSEIPATVSIDGEEVELNDAQKQAYETIWTGTVAGVLDELVTSDSFADADPETQEKMLKYLYTYAAEMAKAELFDTYEISSSTEKFQSALEDGLTVDQYLAMRVSGAKMNDFQEMTDKGMDLDDAYKLSMELSQLQPEDGEDKVQDVQRWRECVEFSSVAAVQISALYSQMTEAQFKKLETAYTFDIDPDVFVGYYEIREQFDENENGSYSNAEVKAAIDSMTSYKLSKEQKAVLWQLMTGSKSAKNNPYSTSEAQRLLDYLSEE